MIETNREIVDNSFEEAIRQSKRNILKGIEYLQKLRAKGHKFTPEQEEILKEFTSFIDKRIEELTEKE